MAKSQKKSRVAGRPDPARRRGTDTSSAVRGLRARLAEGHGRCLATDMITVEGRKVGSCTGKSSTKTGIAENYRPHVMILVMPGPLDDHGPNRVRSVGRESVSVCGE